MTELPPIALFTKETIATQLEEVNPARNNVEIFFWCDRPVIFQKNISLSFQRETKINGEK